MTSANIFFVFDIQTSKLLGSFVFQGTVKRIYSSDNGNIMLDIDGYFLIPWGDITPVRRNGIVEVNVSEIKGLKDGAILGAAVIPFPCGARPEVLIKTAIEEIGNDLREKVKDFDRQLKERINAINMMRFYTMVPPSNKYTS